MLTEGIAATGRYRKQTADTPRCLPSFFALAEGASWNYNEENTHREGRPMTQTEMIYRRRSCRSGRRSKLAAEALAELGYTNIKEFGGVLDWPYEVE